MIAAIMQPTYLPWIGYFDLIDQVDLFVFFDDVQVLKRSWGVRNRVLTSNGPHFLTVPLSGHTHGKGSPFVSTKIDISRDWQQSHLGTIRHSYAKAQHFSSVYPFMEQILTQGHATIGELNETFITETARKMGVDTPFARTSDMTSITGAKEKRLLSICNNVGAITYLSARGSAEYIEEEAEGGAFDGSSTSIVYQNYDHPAYPQHGSSFVSHMSIVDLLMNVGFGNARDVIRSGRRPPLTSSDIRASRQ